jgi:hypothetical protein
VINIFNLSHETPREPISVSMTSFNKETAVYSILVFKIIFPFHRPRRYINYWGLTEIHPVLWTPHDMRHKLQLDICNQAMKLTFRRVASELHIERHRCHEFKDAQVPELDEQLEAICYSIIRLK